jgi:hypothetical protein
VVEFYWVHKDKKDRVDAQMVTDKRSFLKIDFCARGVIAVTSLFLAVILGTSKIGRKKT